MIDGLIFVSGVALAVYVVRLVEVGRVGLRLVGSLLNILSSKFLAKICIFCKLWTNFKMFNFWGKFSVDFRANF